MDTLQVRITNYVHPQLHPVNKPLLMNQTQGGSIVLIVKATITAMDYDIKNARSIFWSLWLKFEVNYFLSILWQ